MQKLNIQLLLTGNELMTGDIIDSNSAMIAEKCLAIGASIQKKVTVADNLTLLVDEIRHLSAQADILIINGGLGPTVDDLTAQALAFASNDILSEHAKAISHLNAWSKQRATTLDSANLKQAMLPSKAQIIDNSKGSAVGFHINFQQCDIYCTPGVPHELEAMLDEQIIPTLKPKMPQADHYKVVRLQTFGMGESRLQQLITDNLPDWPSTIELGFRAASPLLEIKLTSKNLDDINLLAQWQEKIEELLGAHVLKQITDSTPSMAQYVVEELSKQKKKITLAESCTGGLIASLLTNISGSSNVFEAGFVTYSNSMKSQMIDVNDQVLEKYGAVSKQVVYQMAQGALKVSGADYAIAVSGIAGPNGGTEEKPVGTVWIAWGNKSNIKTHQFFIKGNRQYFQIMVATRALDLIRRELLASKELPFYMNTTS